jgi:hypothetical protein
MFIYETKRTYLLLNLVYELPEDGTRRAEICRSIFCGVI